MTEQQAIRMALEALKKIERTTYHIERPPIESLEEKMRNIAREAIPALRQALEQQPADEPVTEKKDLLYATVAMQEREAQRIERIVGTLERIKQQPADEPVAWGDLLKEAEQIVRGKFLWKKFIDGTPLANDVPCWMADFAQQHTRPQPTQCSATWIGLTNEDREHIVNNSMTPACVAVATEAKLKEKNSHD